MPCPFGNACGAGKLTHDHQINPQPSNQPKSRPSGRKSDQNPTETGQKMNWSVGLKYLLPVQIFLLLSSSLAVERRKGKTVHFRIEWMRLVAPKRA
jgi:hypothetical protein